MSDPVPQWHRPGHRKAVRGGDEPHCRLPVPGAPTRVGAGPTSRCHPQPGDDRTAEHQLRLDQAGHDAADRRGTACGQAAGTVASGEERSLIGDSEISN